MKTPQGNAIAEKTICFKVGTDLLYGVMCLPANSSKRGVLFIVGGPQYRAGSHRQFTLLSRDLALNGFSTMRFDYRGMGDSEGDAYDFLNIHDDIQSAINSFLLNNPYLSEIVLWGLCDGASAAMLYASGDLRVKGLILINPWIRTEAGSAKAHLKHYYKDRLTDPLLWKKILHGQFSYRATAKSLLSQISQILKTDKASGETAQQAHLPDQILTAMQQFTGKTLIILSENDLTAREFADVLHGSKQWKNLSISPQFRVHELKNANHTFSQRVWRDQVASWTDEWLKSW
ncbi:hydrolase 1, exosortase A system-associated [Undibacterium sp. RuTC16W]|uniref:hydrolase 1, exosortase A system-associated n=1 Tax=Undibacterium sp. RuTC16W TaxID=3413048 RepID=UPI003BF1D713